MLFILVALFLVGCSQWSVHDTVDSLPSGIYTIDRASFARAPECLQRFIARMLKERGFMPNKLNTPRHLARYRIYARYSLVDGKAILHILADNTHSRVNDALISITRTKDPSETEEEHIRHMVNALDSKFPNVGGSGAGTCVFIYGEESRPTWNTLTKKGSAN